MDEPALYSFGTPKLEIDGVAAKLERRKALALLVYLAATGQTHSRDALAIMLWPESDRGRARASLRRLLWELNNALGVWLELDRDTVTPGPPEALWFDFEQFRRAVALYRSHNHDSGLCPTCLPAAAKAVELYTGDFLAGLTLRDCPEFDDWQFFQADQLRRDCAVILEALVQHFGRQSEFDLAIDFARRWLKLDPLHEPAHRQLIQLYAWSGRRGAAARQYAQCLHILSEELGVSPQESTTQVYETIKRAPHRVAYLKVVGGPGAPAGERFVLGRSTTIGYGLRSNDVHLEDGYVSKRHARIDYQTGQYALHDLESTNGTTLNGAGLEPRRPYLLSTGDEIKIGRTRLLFAFADTQSLGDEEDEHETLKM
ncbi:MAG: BTAD domain-containing putative transcriptional regulator [Anaerolineales bacterium]